MFESLYYSEIEDVSISREFSTVGGNVSAITKKTPSDDEVDELSKRDLTKDDVKKLTKTLEGMIL